jgi:hypothetical protein
VAGETTVALDLPGVAVEDCLSYSVFTIGSAANPAVGDNALQVVVAVDGTASPDMPAPPETDTLGSDQAAPVTGLPLGLLAVAGVAFLASLRKLAVRRAADGGPRAQG